MARTVAIGDHAVTAMGLGCMSMSDFYGPADEQEAVATIHLAIDRGVNLLDTADVYGPFTNEVLVGKTIRHRRSEVFLATKFGIVRNSAGQFQGINGRPEYLRACCEASLKRLGVDHIDLYYQHRVDPSTPIEETIGEMKRLVEEGKVRYLGLSEAAPETIERAFAVHPIAALQTEYSLWSRDPEKKLLELTKELGIAFVSYSPLGRGFLSGHIRSLDDLAADDWRRANPRFQGENFKKNLLLVERVREIAERKGTSPVRVALAWVLAQSDHIVVLPGTTRRAHLEENLQALEFPTNKAELAELNGVFPVGIAAGDRYPDMSAVDR
jgi:aryl-alcohol dehydrogenase-like predicted oxidoreductase